MSGEADVILVAGTPLKAVVHAGAFVKGEWGADIVDGKLSTKRGWPVGQPTGPWPLGSAPETPGAAPRWRRASQKDGTARRSAEYGEHP